MKLVILESPFAGATPEEVAENVAYARACMVDSLGRGEAPFASHLLYAQSGILDDNVPAQRNLGIAAGLSWGAHAEATVVYADRGFTPGMELGIARAHAEGRPVILRYLDPLSLLGRRARYKLPKHNEPDASDAARAANVALGNELRSRFALYRKPGSSTPSVQPAKKGD